jgi:hypothetical protein
MQLLTSGAGEELYTLRYPINLINGYGLSPGHDAHHLKRFGRPTEILPTAYGFLVIARGFSSHAAALAFAQRLHVAARTVSLEYSYPILTDLEPAVIHRTAELINLDSPPKPIHGIAPETMYTILREDEIIMSAGELRGSGAFGVPLQSFAHFLDQAARAPGLQCDFVNTACNFWSLACLAVGEVVELTNVVSALEVLSNVTGRKRKGAQALKATVLHFGERANVVLRTLGISNLKDAVALCDRVWLRRSELIHEAIRQGRLRRTRRRRADSASTYFGSLSPI